MAHEVLNEMQVEPLHTVIGLVELKFVELEPAIQESTGKPRRDRRSADLTRLISPNPDVNFRSQPDCLDLLCFQN